MKHTPLVAASALILTLAGCRTLDAMKEVVAAAMEPGLRQSMADDFVEILPGVRISESIRTVEFDATVAMDCHDPETPDVYLEVICCTPDTREHEALVVTSVPPSSIHAALLALSGEPGHPGGWRREGDDIIPVTPEGSRVRVWFLTAEDEGTLSLMMPQYWIVQHDTREIMAAALPEPGWVFAGSRIREFRGHEVYDADGTGQLIGLHTFGSETIAWTHIESPEASIDEPRWLTNNDLVPPIGTPVRVRIELVTASDPR